MKDIALEEKIEGLPDSLKEQVSDYIDFLLYQYGNNQPTLTTEEKATLDDRWGASQQNPSSTNSLEDVQERLRKAEGYDIGRVAYQPEA